MGHDGAPRVICIKVINSTSAVRRIVVEPWGNILDLPPAGSVLLPVDGLSGGMMELVLNEEQLEVYAPDSTVIVAVDPVTGEELT
jgi:hypothetical protein